MINTFLTAKGFLTPKQSGQEPCLGTCSHQRTGTVQPAPRHPGKIGYGTRCLHLLGHQWQVHFQSDFLTSSSHIHLFLRCWCPSMPSQMLIGQELWSAGEARRADSNCQHTCSLWVHNHGSLLWRTLENKSMKHRMPG